MRKIQFRGKELGSGIWVYGSLLNYDPCPVIQSTELYENAYDYDQWEVNTETVGQYTGLKDKNGVEIYEGDILQEGDKTIWSRYEVVWKQDFCSFGLDCKRVSPNIQYPSWNRAKNMVIIGNIHSNPELLK